MQEQCNRCRVSVGTTGIWQQYVPWYKCRICNKILCGKCSDMALLGNDFGDYVCSACIVELDKIEILHIGDAPNTRCHNCIIDSQAEILRTRAYEDSRYALLALKFLCFKLGGHKIGNFCLEQGYLGKTYAPCYVATGQIASVCTEQGCVVQPKTPAKYAPADLMVVKSGQVGGHKTIQKFAPLVTLFWHRQSQDAVTELCKICCDRFGEANAILNLKITKETGEEPSNEGWGKHLFSVFRAEGVPAIVQKNACNKQNDLMRAAELLFARGIVAEEEFRILKDKIVAFYKSNKK